MILITITVNITNVFKNTLITCLVLKPSVTNGLSNKKESNVTKYTIYQPQSKNKCQNTTKLVTHKTSLTVTQPLSMPLTFATKLLTSQIISPTIILSITTVLQNKNKLKPLMVVQCATAKKSIWKPLIMESAPPQKIWPPHLSNLKKSSQIASKN